MLEKGSMTERVQTGFHVFLAIDGMKIWWWVGKFACSVDINDTQLDSSTQSSDWKVKVLILRWLGYSSNAHILLDVF